MLPPPNNSLKGWKVTGRFDCPGERSLRGRLHGVPVEAESCQFYSLPPEVIDGAVRKPSHNMPIFDADEAPTVRKEGRNVRATAGRLNFLFPNSDRDAVAETYRRQPARTRDYFGPRWVSHHGANIGAPAFLELIQEASLHWKYFCVVNRMLVRILHSGWEHPQTRRIIQATVERNFPPGSDEAVQLCAHLMGVSQVEYLNGREDDRWFLCIWWLPGS